MTRDLDLTAARQVRAMDDAAEPLCERCEASFRASGDVLCAECRYDVSGDEPSDDEASRA